MVALINCTTARVANFQPPLTFTIEFSLRTGTYHSRPASDMGTIVFSSLFLCCWLSIVCAQG